MHWKLEEKVREGQGGRDRNGDKVRRKIIVEEALKKKFGKKRKERSGRETVLP